MFDDMFIETAIFGNTITLKYINDDPNDVLDKDTSICVEETTY